MVLDAPDTVMVFAAGRGTRMGALTANRPKPLIEVGGKALLDHALDLAAAAGLPRAVVNTHYLADRIAAHLRGRARPGIRLSDEQPELLDTGGGIKAAAPLLARPQVFALNADAVWRGPNPFDSLRPALAAHDGATLLLVPRERAHGHRGSGDFALGPDGRLARRGDAPSAPYIYTGLQFLDMDDVTAWPEKVFSLNAVWDRQLAEGRLRGVVYPGDWCDVGEAENLALAEEMART